MLSKIISATVYGINAVVVTIETDISRGMPGLNVVGLGDIMVKEAKERIRNAILNSGIDYPNGRITINMSPASVKKRGSHFDLPMAVGILMSSGKMFDKGIENYGFIGELSLDGSLNKVEGILPMVMAIKNEGLRNVVIPKDNYIEATLIEDINIFPVENLEEVIDFFNMDGILQSKKNFRGKIIENSFEKSSHCNLDFKDVKGQEFAKRAITIAVAGGHGMLMVGSPASGKTMLAERIPSIMPEMNFDEIVEDTIIYSVSGLLSKDLPYINVRPFRQPHHSITKAGLLGGGVVPKPGEITLANGGILFLDEVGEYSRELIEALRIPLEQKQITILRRGESFTFPADFMLIAAANPCKCGYYGDPLHKCKCKDWEIEKYQKKFSGPILDRIDIHIKLQPIEYDELNNNNKEGSWEMRTKIENARSRQKKRFEQENITLNNQMTEYHLEKYCKTQDDTSKMLLKNAYDKMQLNPRTLLKVRKMARTIADLEESENVEFQHFAEALQYREQVGI